MTTRDEMNAEIKSTVVPALRDLGFKGSFPHFYRVIDKHVDLATVQFASAGGSFAIEIGYADQGRNNVYIHKETPAKKLRVSQTTIRRRLGAEDDGSDFWFVYDGERPFGISAASKQLASTAKELLESQAVEWWNLHRNGT